MKITSDHFGVTPEGLEVQLFSLSNDQGMEVRIMNYGGIITAIYVPDRNGKLDDVVLGHETLEGYLNRSRYFGALIALAFISVVTFGFQSWINNVQTLPSDFFSPQAVAAVAGLGGVGAGIGAILYVLTTGWMVDHFSYTPILIIDRKSVV